MMSLDMDAETIFKEKAIITKFAPLSAHCIYFGHDIYIFKAI